MEETARILVRRGDMEAAYKVLARVYLAATPEQVERKVKTSKSLVLEVDCLMFVMP